MRTFIFLLCSTAFGFTSAEVFSQNTKIHIDKDQMVSIDEVFDLLRNQTDYTFIYEEDLFKDVPKVQLKKGTIRANKLLEICFSGKDFELDLKEDKIIIIAKEPSGTALQTFTVSGTVMDTDGQPLPGANIVEKGTTNGVTADFDGNFSINLNGDNAVLIVSYIGYATKEVVVNGQPIVNITLEESAAGLDEVVVVGYGSVKKEDLTGSVAVLNVDEITKVPVANIDQTLQGMASGVFVTSVNGSPGAASSIRIRGGNSINAGNEPLFVVDGFIGDRSILLGIYPEDIASISILKDASATSIYGARGSNGVVIISTKQGREGKAEITFSNSFGIQNIARKIEMLGAMEYIDYTNQGELYLGNLPGFSAEDIARIGNGTDWQDELTRSASMYKAQLSIGGGDERTKYYLSGNYFDQEGLLIGNKYRKIGTRMNFSHVFNDFFEIGTNINFSNIRDIPAKFGWQSILSVQPTLPVRLPDGSYSVTKDVTGRNFDNPVARNEFVDHNIKQNLIFINSYVKLNFNKNLGWKSTFGYNFNNRKTQLFAQEQLPFNLLGGISGSGSVVSAISYSILSENTLTYNAEIDENNTINFLMGATAQREQFESNSSSSSNTLTDQLGIYGLGLSSPEFTNVNVDYDAFSLLSFIGRLNYSYKDKYLATITARSDGSSKFGLNNRFAFFPSFALAWRLSNEKFIEDLDIFSTLKLKVSYGKTGNSNGIDSFQRFQALSTVFGSLGRGTRDVGVRNDRLPNDNLKWETTEQYDIGLESGFFNGRLNLEVDLFYKRTNDLLFTREIPSQAGYATRLENIGSVENKGVDFGLNSVVVDTPDFKWNFGFNISTYINKILDLGGSDYINTHSLGGIIVGPSGQLRIGEPLGIFTGYVTNGVYSNQDEVDQDNFTNGYVPGEFRFVDQNGDGTIDISGDFSVIGDSNPDFYGGFQNIFQYKNFELATFFQFSYGNDIYNLPKPFMFRPHENNVYKLYKDAWTPENPNTNVPMSQALNAQSSNDFNIEDGSFLRLRTLELAYNFKRGMESLPFKSARIYFSGTNLFQIVSKDFSGDDPEANQFGLNDRLRGYYNFEYPNPRTLLLGIEMKF